MFRNVGTQTGTKMFLSSPTETTPFQIHTAFGRHVHVIIQLDKRPISQETCGLAIMGKACVITVITLAMDKFY